MRNGMYAVGAVILWSSLAAMVSSAADSKTTIYYQPGVQLDADKTFNVVLPDGVILSGYVKDEGGGPVDRAMVSAMNTNGYAYLRIRI